MKSTPTSTSRCQSRLKLTSCRGLTRRFWVSSRTFHSPPTSSSSTNSLMQSDTRLPGRLNVPTTVSSWRICRRCLWSMTRPSWWSSLSRTNRWMRSRSKTRLYGRSEAIDSTSWKRRRRWRTFQAFAWSARHWSTPQNSIELFERIKANCVVSSVS